eukprot:TRINITY_DN5414_c0_g1_i1.p1 TRINITY_DN5414_c0_g1~~TRINITY_DN5414_c0_g1_i1.p1  ORF type:complete len:578 (-),score=84.38 TRINITY_DN5414_c0_g1_i1:16-1749(-)
MNEFDISLEGGLLERVSDPSVDSLIEQRSSKRIETERRPHKKNDKKKKKKNPKKKKKKKTKQETAGEPVFYFAAIGNMEPVAPAYMGHAEYKERDKFVSRMEPPTPASIGSVETEKLAEPTFSGRRAKKRKSDASDAGDGVSTMEPSTPTSIGSVETEKLAEPTFSGRKAKTRKGDASDAVDGVSKQRSRRTSWKRAASDAGDGVLNQRSRRTSRKRDASDARDGVSKQRSRRTSRFGILNRRKSSRDRQRSSILRQRHNGREVTLESVEAEETRVKERVCNRVERVYLWFFPDHEPDPAKRKEQTRLSKFLANIWPRIITALLLKNSYVQKAIGGVAEVVAQQTVSAMKKISGNASMELAPGVAAGTAVQGATLVSKTILNSHRVLFFVRDSIKVFRRACKATLYTCMGGIQIVCWICSIISLALMILGISVTVPLGVTTVGLSSLTFYVKITVQLLSKRICDFFHKGRLMINKLLFGAAEDLEKAASKDDLSKEAGASPDIHVDSDARNAIRRTASELNASAQSPDVQRLFKEAVESTASELSTVGLGSAATVMAASAASKASVLQLTEWLALTH